MLNEEKLFQTVKTLGQRGWPGVKVNINEIEKDIKDSVGHYIVDFDHWITFCDLLEIEIKDEEKLFDDLAKKYNTTNEIVSKIAYSPSNAYYHLINSKRDC